MKLVAAAAAKPKTQRYSPPLRGTLISARQYFKGTSPYTSPITSSCQKNFVVMVTDGLPTGDTSGNLYSAAARTNTYNAGPATWTFGTAAQDAINAACALRLPYTSSSLCAGPAPTGTPAADPIPPSDIETYVLALGDTVQNAGAVAVMNAMAKAGGTNTAYFATTSSAFQTAFDNIAASILGKIGAASAVATNSTALSTNSFIYQANFDTTDWSGQLRSFGINATTGAISTTPRVGGRSDFLENRRHHLNSNLHATQYFHFQALYGDGYSFPLASKSGCTVRFRVGHKPERCAG